jgi:hypothetical protein
VDRLGATVEQGGEEAKELIGRPRAEFVNLFDPNSKASAPALLEEVYTRVAERHKQDLRASLNPDDGGTHMGRWLARIQKAVQENAQPIQREVRELRTNW